MSSCTGGEVGTNAVELTTIAFAEPVRLCKPGRFSPN